MTQQRKRICILGGGFGGLYTALRLNNLSWDGFSKPEIVLIDKNDRFLFSPLLYELITQEMQTWEVAPPYQELLADTSVTFRQGVVTKINIEAGELELENLPTLKYDKLVIATGGTTPVDLVSGAKDHAFAFRSLQDAMNLKQRLQELENSSSEYIRIAVVGGGYSGVEVACKLADRIHNRGRIRLVETGNEILKKATEFNREAAKKALESRRVWLDLETQVESITADTISLEYKQQVDILPVDLVVWTVGNQVSPLVKDLPFKTNEAGLLTTNEFLQVLDHPDIYALGDVIDCVDAIGQQVPSTAQAAFQQSDYCGWNLWASLTNKPLLPFRYQALGEIMTLGSENATVSGLGLKFDGVLAHLARRLIYLYRFPTLKHQLNVGLHWLTNPILDLLETK